MNSNNRKQGNASQNTAGQNTKTEQAERDDEKFWAEWWREYAQTWK